MTGRWMMDLWSSGESGVTLLEGGGKRPCCVPFIADLQEVTWHDRTLNKNFKFYFNKKNLGMLPFCIH
ncbi:hypothetical protein YC2023_110644 [Brassica napus]